MYSNRVPIYAQQASAGKSQPSKVSAHPAFSKALQSSDSEDETPQTGVGLGGKPGKHNYLAMAEMSKNTFRDDLLSFVETEKGEQGQNTAAVDNYDARYEIMQKQRQQLEGGRLADQKGVRYMDQIREATERRKREQMINFEKIAAKQLQREGKTFDGTQKFLTQTYLEMLEKNKQFEAQDTQKEEWNQTHSAANRQDMSNFYKRMFHQNMMFGGLGTGEDPELELVAQKEAGGGFSISLSEAAVQHEEEAAAPKRDRSRSRDKETLLAPNGSLGEHTNATVGPTIGEEAPVKLAPSLTPQTSETTQPAANSTPELSREEKIRLAKEKRKERLQAGATN